MKIGIITFWQSNDNYGQLLQCYALQAYLIKIGHQPYLIRYDLLNRGKHSFNFYLKKMIKVFICYNQIVKILIKYKKSDNKVLIDSVDRDFDVFRNNYIIKSEQIYKNLADLKKNPPQADLYITGSDQVWAHLLDDKENKVFFLDFGKPETIRVSYAASFAMDQYPTNITNNLKCALSNLNSLSVRENSGMEICSRLGFQVHKVVDPTLLLYQAEYESIIEKQNKYTFDYIYLYLINITNKKEIQWLHLKKHAFNNQFRIVVTQASGYIPATKLFEDEEVFPDNATIGKWLSNIKYSQSVITTSFHGIVFSLLFHKPFVFIPLEGNFSRGNNRIFDLLESLGLQNRILTENNSYRKIFSNNIDWSDVDKRQEVQRHESYKFIEKSLYSK